MCPGHWLGECFGIYVLRREHVGFDLAAFSNDNGGEQTLVMALDECELTVVKSV
jgi:hypothetical protein